jgi:DNA (cytosine-5)-methyltransferase 1
LIGEQAMTLLSDADGTAAESLIAEPREITLLSNARRMLAEARTIHEVKDIRDKAEALRMYLKQRGESLKVQNAAAEIKIRAECRAGELLKAGPINRGGRPSENSSHDESGFVPTLSDHGIDHNESFRWKRMAGISEEVLACHIEETNGHGKELTTASVLKLAPKAKPTEPPPWDIVAAAVQVDRTIARLFESWPVEHHVDLATRIEAQTRLFRGGSEPICIVPVIPAIPTVQAECRPFTYGSVCSGIEAATVAWHPLGWQPKWFAEIAEFPSAVLAHRHPDVPNLGDFTAIGEQHGPIDLLVGGTPCQAFSVTGLRGGLADERGNLALEYLRLAQRLCPRWLVWENVCGVLSIDEGRAFGSFVGGLEELGYGWAYRVLDARHFGIPQRRKRVFVVGYLGDVRPAICALFERESLSENPRTTRAKQATAADRVRCDARSLFGEADDDRGGDERPLIYGWNGDEEFKYAEAISTTLRAAQGGEGNGFATDDEVRCFTAIERERLMGFPDDYTKIPYRGQPADRCPANARAHALGNSMAVPCMAWIGRRIDSIRSLIPHH